MILGGPVVFSWRGSQGRIRQDTGELNAKGEPCWDIQGGSMGDARTSVGLTA